MQPAPQGESGSLLITHLFKIMNCLEGSDGWAVPAAASGWDPSKAKGYHTCGPCPWAGAAVVEGLQVGRRRAPFGWENRCVGSVLCAGVWNAFPSREPLQPFPQSFVWLCRLSQAVPFF